MTSICLLIILVLISFNLLTSKGTRDVKSRQSRPTVTCTCVGVPKVLTCVAGVPKVLPKAVGWAPNPVAGWEVEAPNRFVVWVAGNILQFRLFIIQILIHFLRGQLVFSNRENSLSKLKSPKNYLSGSNFNIFSTFLSKRIVSIIKFPVSNIPKISLVSCPIYQNQISQQILNILDCLLCDKCVVIYF